MLPADDQQQVLSSLFFYSRFIFNPKSENFKTAKIGIKAVFNKRK